MSDGQTLNTTIEHGPNGEKILVESFTYEVAGEQREQSRRIPQPVEAPDPRELEYGVIEREDGRRCADLVVALAGDLGCGFTRARQILIATGDAQYRTALLAHVEAMRVAVKARRAAREAGAARTLLVEKKNSAARRVRSTELEIEREEKILRETPRLTRSVTGLAPHRRAAVELRERLAKQQAELQAARADLAAYDAKASA